MTVYEKIIDRYHKAYRGYRPNETHDDVKVLNKAFDLLEKQEQGLLIELPVPIGSTTYNTEFEIIEPLLLIHETITYIKEGWGKTIFATREEAEKRLEELRNG